MTFSCFEWVLLPLSLNEENDASVKYLLHVFTLPGTILNAVIKSNHLVKGLMKLFVMLGLISGSSNTLKIRTLPHSARSGNFSQMYSGREKSKLLFVRSERACRARCSAHNGAETLPTNRCVVKIPSRRFHGSAQTFLRD